MPYGAGLTCSDKQYHIWYQSTWNRLAFKISRGCNVVQLHSIVYIDAETHWVTLAALARWQTHYRSGYRGPQRQMDIAELSVWAEHVYRLGLTPGKLAHCLIASPPKLDTLACDCVVCLHSNIDIGSALVIGVTRVGTGILLIGAQQDTRNAHDFLLILSPCIQKKARYHAPRVQ
jgi:hypothetical protein